MAVLIIMKKQKKKRKHGHRTFDASKLVLPRKSITLTHVKVVIHLGARNVSKRNPSLGRRFFDNSHHLLMNFCCVRRQKISLQSRAALKSTGIAFCATDQCWVVRQKCHVYCKRFRVNERISDPFSFATFQFNSFNPLHCKLLRPFLNF